MFSVVRFAASKERLDELLAIGRAMNDRQPGVFKGLRGAGDGFTCVLSKEPDWASHVAALRLFLHEHQLSIRAATSAGANVVVDVAVDEDDVRAVRYYLPLRCDTDLLTVMVAFGVSLEFTFYRSDPPPPT
jgi:hypothetical protein